MVSCTQQSWNFRYNQAHTFMNIVYSMYIHVKYRYVNVHIMYIHVYTMYVHYLWIHSMKTVFWHIKWMTPCTHDSPAKIRLPHMTPLHRLDYNIHTHTRCLCTCLYLFVQVCACYVCVCTFMTLYIHVYHMCIPCRHNTYFMDVQ